MKILILGTSNSVRRNGWVKGLSDRLVDSEVSNLSIGASPGLQFSVFARMDFSVYDYVFFDSLPNDEEYFLKTNSFKNYNFYNEIYFEFLSTIASQTKLVIIAIPLLATLHNTTIIYRTRELLARRLGAQFLCFKHIIENINAFSNSLIDNLYDMDPHPTEFIANFIGSMVAQVLEDEQSKSSLGFMSDNINYSENFIIRNVSEEYAEDKKYEIKNSLFQETFAFLNQDDEIKISEPMTLIGFYINKKNTKSHLKLMSGHETAASISLYRDIDLSSFLKIFIPSPVNTQNDRIVIDYEAPTDSSVPLTYHPQVSKKIAEHPVLSISTLCFWRPSGTKWVKDVRQTFDARRITHLVNLKINKAVIDGLKASLDDQLLITSSHGYVMLYDTVLQKCISIDKNLTAIYPNPLLPVTISMVDHQQVVFSVKLAGISVPLSCYKNGIGLAENHALRENKRFDLGDYIADKVSLFGLKGNKYAFGINDVYLRCYKVNVNNGFSFNAAKISLWETFSLGRE